ncbi:hypothetical protein D3C85_1058570 [compost metagenome]
MATLYLFALAFTYKVPCCVSLTFACLLSKVKVKSVFTTSYERYFLLTSAKIAFALGSVCAETELKTPSAKNANINFLISVNLILFYLLLRLLKNCSKAYSSGIKTSRALLPSNGPTMPAPSNWSIILPALL